jgi:general secretion pathway protein D
VTKVIRLQSTDADMLRGVLGNFISPQGADIQSIPPDTLIITDSGLNIRRIEKMLETIDRPGAGDVIRILQLRYASAKDVADKLNQIFQAQGTGRGRRGLASGSSIFRPPQAGTPGSQPPGAGQQPGAVQQPGVVQQPGAVDVSMSRVLPDERTNKLIVIADEKSYQRVLDLVEQLDVPTGADGGIHVVFLKNASAEELAATLSSLAQGQAKRPSTVPAAMPAPPGAPGAAIRPPGSPEAATAEIFSGEVKISADKAQNALLVQASGADFAAISRLIEKLDRPRRQVFVEAVVMEVNLSNETDLGVGAHGFVDVDVNGKKGVLPIVSAPGTVNSLSLVNPSTVVALGGFLTGFSGPTSGVLKDMTGLSLPSIGLLIRALQSSSDVNVISTPHVLATDNEDSEIIVGQNVPFQTGYFPAGLSSLLSGTTGTNTTTPITSTNLGSFAAGIQRQNVELRLKMKPQINDGGNVRLSVEVQNEEITSTDPTLGPTTAKRSVKTQIVARDQSTIVIGGLIQERSTRSVKKVPVLGSLPVLGALFRDTSTVKQKTNLLVFLTPYIIRDESDYRRIFEKKKKEQEDFMVQFYGRKFPYQVDVDYSRKPGPLTLIHAGVVEETARLENGGPGLPGQGMSSPPGGPGKAQPALPADRERVKPAAPPAETAPPPRMPPAEPEELPTPTEPAPPDLGDQGQ